MSKPHPAKRTPANRFPTLAEQLARKCRHFNGIQNGTCEAGVSYADVTVGGVAAYLAARPCFKPDPGEPKRPAVTCLKQSFKTDQEVAAEVEEVRVRFAGTVIAREAIIEATKGQTRVGGQIPCPVCKQGALHYSVAGNGHVHARCETAKCVAWME